jgi:XTP/dITP diphosphohydrolase
MIAIRSAWPDDVEAMLTVARTLPEWFNDHGLAEMTRDFASQQAAVAVAEEAGQERVVGFITWAPSPHTPEPGLVELTWLGVDQSSQGHGVGRRLVAMLEELCRSEGAHTIQVATLADSVDYEPYVATRAFYRAIGFQDYQVDKDFYGEGDHRLLLRKAVTN